MSLVNETVRAIKFRGVSPGGLVMEVRTQSGLILRDAELLRACAKPHDCEPYVETGGCTHVEPFISWLWVGAGQ